VIKDVVDLWIFTYFDIFFKDCKSLIFLLEELIKFIYFCSSIYNSWFFAKTRSYSSGKH